MTRWLLIRPDEDGNPIRWLDQRGFDELLDNPKDNYGVTEFLADIPPEKDPAYWPDGTALLMRAEIVVPSPVEVVTRWAVPGEMP